MNWGRGAHFTPWQALRASKKSSPPGAPSAFHYSITMKRSVRNYWLLSFEGAGGDPRQAYTIPGYFHYTSSELKPIILDLTRFKNKNLDLDRYVKGKLLQPSQAQRQHCYLALWSSAGTASSTGMSSRQARQTGGKDHSACPQQTGRWATSTVTQWAHRFQLHSPRDIHKQINRLVYLTV